MASGAVVHTPRTQKEALALKDIQFFTTAAMDQPKGYVQRATQSRIYFNNGGQEQDKHNKQKWVPYNTPLFAQAQKSTSEGARQSNTKDTKEAKEMEAAQTLAKLARQVRDKNSSVKHPASYDHFTVSTFDSKTGPATESASSTTAAATAKTPTPGDIVCHQEQSGKIECEEVQAPIRVCAQNPADPEKTICVTLNSHPVPPPPPHTLEQRVEQEWSDGQAKYAKEMKILEAARIRRLEAFNVFHEISTVNEKVKRLQETVNQKKDGKGTNQVHVVTACCDTNSATSREKREEQELETLKDTIYQANRTEQKEADVHTVNSAYMDAVHRLLAHVYLACACAANQN